MGSATELGCGQPRDGIGPACSSLCRSRPAEVDIGMCGTRWFRQTSVMRPRVTNSCDLAARA